MKLFITLITLFISINSFSYGKIDWNNFNNKSFNTIVAKKISNLRKFGVKFDSTCFQAAEMHGLYMVNNKITFEEFRANTNGSFGGHLEPLSINTNTVRQRLIFFRIKSSLSLEVCAMLNTSKGETYEKLSDRVIDQYLSSTPHRKIVMGKNAPFFGASIHTTEQGVVYSVIVFSSTSFTKIPNEDIARSNKIYDSILNIRDSVYTEKFNKGWGDEVKRKDVMSTFLSDYETRVGINKKLRIETEAVNGINNIIYLICKSIHPYKVYESDKSAQAVHALIEQDLKERKAKYNAQKKPLN